MPADFFEVYSISGSTLKFNVDRDVNNQLTLATTQTTGNVSVLNFPATQPISGSISVSNFPANQVISGSVNNAFLESSASAVSVGTTLTTILSVDTRPYSFISFEIINGATALVECQVQVRYHSGSSVWNPKTFGATEYTTGSGKQSGNPLISIIEASGNLNILGASTNGWVEINCSRYESVRIQARVTSGTSSVTCRSITK